MKITLCDGNNALIEAWRDSFKGQSGISIVKGDITKIKCDAMASPANSFGFMDGGIDFEISERFGWDLHKRLQQTIKLLPEGELLVGQAIILETGDKRVPWLISAPTMRVPMDFNIGTSVNINSDAYQEYIKK
jgi:O-acetyl-ADP-ribose deacetylase (regulator of RNase III)